MKLPLTSVAAGVFLAGCTSQSATNSPSEPSHREDRVLLLDNSGGYSHAGRRIELLKDGKFIETRYTDVIGNQNRRSGRYDLSEGILNLHFDDRGSQRLIRVPYGTEILWVYPNEVEKISLSERTRLRQTSLKQQGGLLEQ